MRETTQVRLTAPFSALEALRRSASFRSLPNAIAVRLTMAATIADCASDPHLPVVVVDLADTIARHLPPAPSPPRRGRVGDHRLAEGPE